MPRIRTIKPDFWDSPATGQASLRARLLFIAMWNWADDFGIGDAHSGRLWNFAFPNDRVNPADIPAVYAEVSNLFGVIFYEHEGRPYYYIPSWNKHQKIDRRSVQKVPYPDEGTPTLFPAIPGPPEPADIPPKSQRNHPVGTEELGTEELGTTLTSGGASNETPTPKSRRKPKRALPENWEPKQRHVDYCRNLHLDFSRELDKFRGNAKANDVHRADWDQAFDNWLKKAVEFRERDRRGPNTATTDDRVQGWLDIAQQASYPQAQTLGIGS